MATTDWDTGIPSSGDQISDGATDIREFKDQYALRQDKEHVALGNSSAGGIHTAGSAVAFYASSAPTTRIDGSAFTSADNGRLFINSTTKGLFYHDGSDFTTEVDYMRYASGTTLTSATTTGLKITANSNIGIDIATTGSSSEGLKITQSLGSAGAIFTKLTGSSGPLFTINSNAGGSGDLISGTINSSGSGFMSITNNSTGTIIGITSASASKGIQVSQSHTTSLDGITVFNVASSSGHGVKSSARGSGDSFNAVLDSTSTGDGLMVLANASSAGDGISVTMAGGGYCMSLNANNSNAHINLDETTNSGPTDGDFWMESDGLHMKDHSTSTHNDIPHADQAMTKTTAGAPYTNDGYVAVTIGGTVYKLMTTA